MADKKELSDRYTYFVFLYMGVSALIGWNVILSNLDLFLRFVFFINLATQV